MSATREISCGMLQPAANLRAVKWKSMESVNSATIAGVKAAPEGFVQWAALQHGAVENAQAE